MTPCLWLVITSSTTTALFKSATIISKSSRNLSVPEIDSPVQESELRVFQRSLLTRHYPSTVPLCLRYSRHLVFGKLAYCPSSLYFLFVLGSRDTWYVGKLRYCPSSCHNFRILRRLGVFFVMPRTHLLTQISKADCNHWKLRFYLTRNRSPLLVLRRSKS
jgi:hypothetical protein